MSGDTDWLLVALVRAEPRGEPRAKMMYELSDALMTCLDDLDDWAQAQQPAPPTDASASSPRLTASPKVSSTSLRAAPAPPPVPPQLVELQARVQGNLLLLLHA